MKASRDKDGVPYKLAGRGPGLGDSVIRIPGPGGRFVQIGGPSFVVIAGPCAVESGAQMLRIARKVAKAGAHLLRGGAFKPRTSPYSFQGLGEDGLKILAAARAETGLPVVTEALDQKGLDVVYQYADIIQIGARNMQNFALLRDVGRMDKPVLLKRGFSATIDEWLLAAEYILAEGNRNVILCERGIRAFAGLTRATLDLNAVPIVRMLSRLPILVDPSHGTGRREIVAPLARAAAAAGAQGLLIEVHDKADEALCDGPQALAPPQFAELIRALRGMGKAQGYTL